MIPEKLKLNWDKYKRKLFFLPLRKFVGIKKELQLLEKNEFFIRSPPFHEDELREFFIFSHSDTMEEIEMKIKIMKKIFQ